MGFIYILKNKTNNKFYVGQTTQTVRVRLYKHKNRCRDTKIGRAIKKYGFNNFELFFAQFNNEDLDFFEKRSISILNSIEEGYNIESGGNKNRNLSEETKSKIRNKLLGHSVSEIVRNRIGNNNRGRTYEDLYGVEKASKMREKQSKFRRGKKHEWGSKISFAKKDKPKTEEHKKSISNSIIKWWNSAENKRRKLNVGKVKEIRNLYNKEILTKREIAIKFGVKEATIHSIIIGKIWKYVE